MLKCNACWSELEGKSVVTSCQHLYCLKCAQQIVESDSACPICESVITKSTVKVINSLQDASACQLILCGQAPDTALAAALASVQFYISQQLLQAELRENNLTKKISKTNEACRKKLEEVHNGYMQAKRKYEDAMRINQQMSQDNQELQAKYAQKSMQARKLQEALKRMQQENENLRSSGGKNNGGAGMMGGSTGHALARSLSPMAQQGMPQMVTTVQRTQVYANLQSPPNNANFGNALQQAVMPTSGRVQGITGGYRVQQVPGSSGGGGGFLGGSMDPNSPGGMLGTGLRRPGSGNSFGGLGGGGGGGDPGLRKLLGMPPAQGNMSVGRNNAGMRNDMFSM
ncbi:hypothetical protein HYH02_000931 [Chlamydomonas schloesseri]|uniref:RING-type domain-containing protein n=1 Tax=Chlamydomonas schloesseri TaxID=2026947 RepID=A0A835WWR7_9CHLO|nr:hypothetical protein HYH02_000931 [Chlamydomonas schloesseri]|eukprot:KAG2455111.1 hypothetical protein HYH02_000931 [Chlamydomonas schloesseri]